MPRLTREDISLPFLLSRGEPSGAIWGLPGVRAKDRPSSGAYKFLVYFLTGADYTFRFWRFSTYQLDLPHSLPVPPPPLRVLLISL
jgi:hypothetical protein